MHCVDTPLRGYYWIPRLGIFVADLDSLGIELFINLFLVQLLVVQLISNLYYIALDSRPNGLLGEHLISK